MNEYYKIRFNFTKYFINLDIQLSLIKNLIYVVLLLSLIFIISIFNNNNHLNPINFSIYILHIIFLIYISYILLKNIYDIKKNELIINYNNYFELVNCIFKENLANSINIYKTNGIQKNTNLYDLYLINDELIKNVNDIENIYNSPDVNSLLASTSDILKYYDIEKLINNNFDKRLYLTSNSKFNNNRYNKYLNNENNEKYLDLELLNDYPIKSQLLDYLNKKYSKNFSDVYLKPPFLSPSFNNKFNEIIDEFKWNVYNYLMTISFFIFLILHALYLSYNHYITYIYIILIIIFIIILFII